MSKNNFKDVLRVSEEEWHKAQMFESGCWIRQTARPTRSLIGKSVRALASPRLLWRYIKFRDFYVGDDWNYWWLRQFDSYTVLPLQMNKALEIGCGPFTNVRLISRITEIGEIYCADPLVRTYLGFKRTWLPAAVRAKRVHAVECMGESLPFSPNCFDLVICINVLDHVQDAARCMDEGLRVLAPGGYWVFGQDLTNEEDIAQYPSHIGHPVRVHHETLDRFLRPRLTPVFHKLLSRDQGRAPELHYGTYLLIGQKPSAG